MRLIATIIATTLALPAHADMTLQFVEGAPKDRFTLSGTLDCDLGQSALTIDLMPAAGGLIFDVSGAGAGVEVFQPLDVIAGAANLRTMPAIADGQQAVTFDLAALSGDPVLSFTIDIDDTISNRQIIVNGSEIAGAVVSLTSGDTTLNAVFDETATARFTTDDCA